MAEKSRSTRSCTVTGRPARSTSSPARAMAYSRRPRTFTADTMGGVWRKLPRKGASTASSRASDKGGTVGRAPHGARHVQGVRLQPETHHRVVGLVPLGEKPG